MSCQSSPQTLGDRSSYLDTSAGSRAGGALPTLRGVWEESAQLGWNAASLCDCGGTMGRGRGAVVRKGGVSPTGMCSIQND